MRLLTWLLRAFLFFVLFAFALNNTQTVTVHWFFGHYWNTPQVFVVLASFAAGAALGVLAMVPAWWHQRSQIKRQRPLSDTAPSISAEPPAGIRDGL